MASQATPKKSPLAPPSSVEHSTSPGSTCNYVVNNDLLMDLHLSFIQGQSQSQDQLHEIASTPVFTTPVQRHADALRSPSESSIFPQYALIGGNVEDLLRYSETKSVDPRIFQNVAAPSSTFICGSQGSGKSHTLSCILENCLIPHKLGQLPHPLTSIVFHYDTFSSDSGVTPCEAAYLASDSKVNVKVLCAPTNTTKIEVR